MKDYFSFSKRERHAFIGLLVLIAAFLYLPQLFPTAGSKAALDPDINIPTGRVNADSADEDMAGPALMEPAAREEIAPPFYFDPNTLDEAGFVRLGLPLRTARTIIKYRNKGGRFRRPEDLRKIYSLAPEDGDRIIPYARVAVAAGDRYDAPEKRRSSPWKTRAVSPIDINTATAEEWKTLPGIGEVLSARITAYRERIGGFSSVEQVARTWGLPDSTYHKILPYLRLAHPVANKIDLNKAFEAELMECPGIDRELARAIVIYRKQYGPFETVDDLKKIVFVTEETFRRALPCIRVNQLK